MIFVSEVIDYLNQGDKVEFEELNRKYNSKNDNKYVNKMLKIERKISLRSSYLNGMNKLNISRSSTLYFLSHVQKIIANNYFTLYSRYKDNNFYGLGNKYQNLSKKSYSDSNFEIPKIDNHNFYLGKKNLPYYNYPELLVNPVFFDNVNEKRNVSQFFYSSISQAEQMHTLKD